MISQALLREGLGLLQRHLWPEESGVGSTAQVYLVDIPYDDPDRLRTLKVVSNVGTLPWPADQCVLAFEMELTNGARLAAFAVRMSRSIPPEENGIRVEDDSAILLVGAPRENAPTAWRAVNLSLWRDRSPVSGTAFPRPDGFEHVWTGVARELKANNLIGKQCDFHETMVHIAQLLLSFASIVTPTGYVFKTHIPHARRVVKNGRERFKSMPANLYIHRDRLYHLLPEHERERHMITPHGRRGHLRWLRKLSGIFVSPDQLPRDPGERLRWHLERKCRNKYINPMWVGSRRFNLKGLDVEVPEDVEFRGASR